LVQPVEHVHQRALAGTVLTEQRMDLPRLHDQVDGVVGRQGAEALGDPAQFELQGTLRICARARVRGSTGRCSP
jgi:hypothetical protein